MATIDGVTPGAFRVSPPALSARGSSSRSAYGKSDGFAISSENIVPVRAAVADVAGNSGPNMLEMAPAAAGMLAAVQEFGAEPPAERAARRQALLLLRQLSMLQLSLLAGGPDVASLERLSGLVAALDEAISTDIDPGLQKLLRTLALRGRLELARRDCAHGFAF